MYFTLFGSLFILTQYLQFILGYTPLQAGIRTAVIAVVMIVIAPIAGMLVEPLGNKVLVSAGMVVAAFGLFLMSRTGLGSGYAFVLASIVIRASGMALAMCPATESIMGSVPPEKAGVGSAMNDTTRQLGGALGVAVLGSVFASAYTSGLGSELNRLSAVAADRTVSSVGAALAVARSIGGHAGHGLADLAMASFVQAMDQALVVAR